MPIAIVLFLLRNRIPWPESFRSGFALAIGTGIILFFSLAGLLSALVQARGFLEWLSFK